MKLKNLGQGDKVRSVIPTGNFGDVLARYGKGNNIDFSVAKLGQVFRKAYGSEHQEISRHNQRKRHS